MVVHSCRRTPEIVLWVIGELDHKCCHRHEVTTEQRPLIRMRAFIQGTEVAAAFLLDACDSDFKPWDCHGTWYHPHCDFWIGCSF
nr:hypothetical protein [Tanacetum cinerariifolium]